MPRLTATLLSGAVCCAALAGCAGWTKPGATYNDFIRTYAACRYPPRDPRETEGDRWREFGLTLAGVRQDWPLCMKLEGWRVVRSGERYRP